MVENAGRDVDGPARSDGGRPLSVGASILLLVAALLAPLGVVAAWADTTVSDTDRYVETVAPLATDPAVQNMVIDRLTNRVVSNVNADQVAASLADAVAKTGAPPIVVDHTDALAGALKAAPTSAVHQVPSHRAGLMAAGIGIGVMMVVLLVGLAVTRQIYLDSVPPDAQPRDAAAAIYDTLVRFLRNSALTGLTIAVIIVVAGYLYGPGRGARAIRSGAAHATGATGRAIARVGLRTGGPGCCWTGTAASPAGSSSGQGLWPWRCGTLRPRHRSPSSC
ncbi:hypothetical protein [Parafrankia soli]|uniref:hypothetical protein n=1 Tax=Parafrankia soli TaxID=2599596 RepID=UPI001F524488|nr:hypothetical protein [Parafrankia soli]